MLCSKTALRVFANRGMPRKKLLAIRVCFVYFLAHPATTSTCAYIPRNFEAFDFFFFFLSTFNLTGCVSELRLVTLRDVLVVYAFFYYLSTRFSYSFCFINKTKTCREKMVSSNKIMFSNFIFQGARQVHSVSFSTPKTSAQRVEERQRW